MIRNKVPSKIHMTTHYSMNKSGAVSSTNLDAVTSATNGSSLGMRDFRSQSVFVSVSGNTGSVIVTIQASHDGSTWFDLTAKTYSASNENDVWHYTRHLPFMRTKTSTHSNATVTTTITGGN